MIPEADGVYVRCEGKDLVVGRQEALGPKGEPEDDDRLKLTYLRGAYVIWAHLADGEYEFTELGGAIGDLQEHLEGPLLHLLRAWTKPAAKRRGGTSGTRY